MNWTVPCKEGYAVMQLLAKGHAFLGRHFQLLCDSKVLTHIYGSGKDGAIPVSTQKRLRRWSSTIASYDFEIRHIAGHAEKIDDLNATNVYDKRALITMDAVALCVALTSWVHSALTARESLKYIT